MLRDSRFLLLLASGSLTTMAGGVVAPVLPTVIQQLELEPGLAGNLVSAHCLTIALFSPVLGIMADRIGTKRVLIPALVLYACFGVAGALMPSFWPLLLTRGLLGAASGGIAAASLGALGNLYTGDARLRAMGYVTSTLTVASIGFPLVGGLVGTLNWQFAFYLYGLGLPLAVLAALGLPAEQLQPTPSAAGGASAKLLYLLRQPQIFQLLLALAAASGIVYAVVIYVPLYLTATIAASAALNGIVLASRAAGVTAIAAFGGQKLARVLGIGQTIALGFTLMALTLATIPFLDQLPWIMASAVLFGVGFGMVTPNLYATLAALAPADLRSSLLAAGVGLGFLGQFLSPVFLGPVLTGLGLTGVFYTAAAIAGIFALLSFAQRQIATNPTLRAGPPGV